MVTELADGLDRRQRRRQQTLEEVLDTATAIMAEQGVAGLSVGEIARRMGMRPPSLYGYFPSKHALYDALFARGAGLLLAEMRAPLPAGEPATLAGVLLAAARRFAAWSIANQAYSQLLFWRPVPGFTPSPEAYRPAVDLFELNLQWFAELQQRGLLRTDAPLDAALRAWTVLIAGVVSQQLSNAPQEPFENGRFVAALPDLVDMFCRYYAAEAVAPRRTNRKGTPWKPASTR